MLKMVRRNKDEKKKNATANAIEQDGSVKENEVTDGLPCKRVTQKYEKGDESFVLFEC